MSDLRDKLDSLLLEYSPGQKIPGERSLAEKFGVARMTLRIEIENLILQGRLQRKPGSGTYISNMCYSLPARCRSFSAEMKSRGLEPRNEVISAKIVAADKVISSTLRIPTNSKVLKFSRLRYGDDLPMAYQQSTIPFHYIGPLEKGELEGSLEDLLLHKFSISIITSHSEIASEFPDQKIAKLLEIIPSTPCLVKETIDLDQRSRYIMWNRSWYNSERFKIKFDATCAVHEAPKKLTAGYSSNLANSS